MAGNRMGRAGSEPLLSLTVGRIAAEAEDVVSLELVGEPGTQLPEWEPGAHIDLVLAPGLERQYSLCGSPSDRDRWRVAVLREPHSRGGSAYVHERLHAHDLVQARGPRNHFALLRAKRYIFIAGGIGITPILPMIAAVDAEGSAWSLTYGGRRRGSMAFLDQLAEHGERVAIRPENECGLLDLRAALGEFRDETHVYCCGPEPLLAAVELACDGWPSGSLHVERFKPVARPADTGPDHGFEVVLSRSEITLWVDPSETIIDAIEAAGLTVPCSCLEGTCGTCETEVLAGRPDHRDSILTEEERASGTTMMICVSRALTDQLILDL